MVSGTSRSSLYNELLDAQTENIGRTIGYRYDFCKNANGAGFDVYGNPYDNACIESFHSVLKKEEVYTTTYYTFEEAKSALFEYIESFYNRKRRHSALDYKTPQQVEDEALAA